MFADLHIHTQFSDSTRTPREVVYLAKKCGVGLISVSDHNLIKAYRELPALCKEAQISFIVGTEIQSLYNETEYHILAYGFDLENKELNELLTYSNNILEIDTSQLNLTGITILN